MIHSYCVIYSVYIIYIHPVHEKMILHVSLSLSLHRHLQEFSWVKRRELHIALCLWQSSSTTNPTHQPNPKHRTYPTKFTYPQAVIGISPPPYRFIGEVYTNPSAPPQLFPRVAWTRDRRHFVPLSCGWFSPIDWHQGKKNTWEFLIINPYQ